MKNTKLLLSTLVAATALSATPAFADLVWNGSTEGTWDYTSENWYDEIYGSETPTTFSSTSSAKFLDNDSVEITLGSEGISAMIVNFGASGDTYTGSYKITGSDSEKELSFILMNNYTTGTVEISNAGKVDIAVVTNYGGDITIEGGVVDIARVINSGTGTITIKSADVEFDSSFDNETSDTTPGWEGDTSKVAQITTSNGNIVIEGAGGKIVVSSVTSTGSGDITISSATDELGTVSTVNGNITVSSSVKATATSLTSTGSGDITIAATSSDITEIRSTGENGHIYITDVYDENGTKTGNASAVIGTIYSENGDVNISANSVEITSTLEAHNGSVEISSSKADIGSITAYHNNGSTGTITISSDEATVGSGDINGGTLTVSAGSTTVSNTLTVRWGGTVSVSEGASLTTQNLSNTESNAYVTVNGTMSVSSTLSVAGTTQITGTGSLKIGSIESTGTLIIAAENVDISGNVSVTGGTNVYISTTDGTAATSVSNASVSIDGNLSISNTGSNTEIRGSSFTVKGTFDYAAGHTLDLAASTANINDMVISSGYGTLTISSADLYIGSLTSKIAGDNVSLTISSASAKIDSLVSESTKTITISSNEATIGSLAANGSGSITISAGTTTIGTISSSLEDSPAVNLSVSSGATAKIVGDSTNGSVTFDGTLSQTDAGLLEISAATANITTMSITAGALTISGTKLTVENLTKSSNADKTFTISGSAEVVVKEDMTITGATITDLGGSSLTVGGTLDFTASHSLNISADTVDIGTLISASSWDSTSSASAITSSTSVKIGSLQHSVLGSLSITTESLSISELTNTGAGTVTISGSDSNATATIGSISGVSSSTIAVSSPGNVNVTGNVSDEGTLAFSGAGTLTLAAGSEGSETTATIATLNHSGTGTLELASDTLDITTLTHSGTGDLIISSAEATIGTIDSASGSGVSHNITIASGSNVTAGELKRSTGIINLDVEGVLTVAKDEESGASGIMSIGTSGNTFGNEQKISGSGTINAYGIEFWTGSSAVEVSVAQLNIGEGGITRESGGDFEFTGSTIVGLYDTDSATITTNMWLNSTATTFNTEAGQEMTLTGDITGNGGIIKTGAGTLTLSGTATAGYAGGTTISAGKVVATTDNALGQGKVTIAAGAQLEISKNATITNAISLTLTADNLKGEVAVTRAGDSAQYVITGEGTLESAIEISLDSAVVNMLADLQTYEFYVVDTSVDWQSQDETSVYLSSDLVNKGYTVTVADGIVMIRVPEPSMFGVLAGLGALALVATRRRRNRKAA